MARKPRFEVEGGLYHVITRGNDRQDIFHSKDDHLKFLSLVASQKEVFLTSDKRHIVIKRIGVRPAILAR